MGLIKAFASAFPSAEVHGCLFHLVQNLKKKIRDLGLLGRYRNESSFSLSARMIVALAFVPLVHLDNAIAELAVALPEELMPALKYFEDVYVGSLLRTLPDGTVIRKQPLFAPTTWSVYFRTLAGDSRTNNFAEAAHRRLQTEFGVRHPNLWRFTNGLRKVQSHRDMMLARFESGNEAAAKRKKSADLDKKIVALVSTFHTRTLVEYLRGCAASFQMEP
ncbi:uncharacterized protein LOC108863740 [Galendromus occidentalis]|uniref:Uncharacterized protein LOC108863740 n=1 Tax=Galendromus occidentalis TaxID=34638 RepID=A0AAJ7P8Y1_9ACAR|nr:uncharacterized protein LOC108863740 [Galendromus occidentalis]